MSRYLCGPRKAQTALLTSWHVVLSSYHSEASGQVFLSWCQWIYNTRVANCLGTMWRLIELHTAVCSSSAAAAWLTGMCLLFTLHTVNDRNHQHFLQFQTMQQVWTWAGLSPVVVLACGSMAVVLHCLFWWGNTRIHVWVKVGSRPGYASSRGCT